MPQLSNPMQILKTNPQASDVHINGILGQFSVSYAQKQKAFIADRVFPLVGVSKRSDLYPIWTRKGTNIVAMKKRAPGTRVAQIEQSLSTNPYYLDVYALGTPLDDQIADNADDWVDLELAKTGLLTTQAYIFKEYELASNFFKKTVWGVDWTGIAEGTPSTHEFIQWDNDLSNPKQLIEDAKLEMLLMTGHKPNKMVMGIEVWNKLQNHAGIIDLLKYGGQISGNLAVVTLGMITALFGLEEILISEAIYDTETYDPTNESHQFIFGKGMLLFYAPSTPSKWTPSAGYTLYWNKANYYGSYNGFRMKKYREEGFEAYQLEIQGAFTQKQICSDMGMYFDSVVQ